MTHRRAQSLSLRGLWKLHLFFFLCKALKVEFSVSFLRANKFLNHFIACPIFPVQAMTNKTTKKKSKTFIERVQGKNWYPNWHLWQKKSTYKSWEGMMRWHWKRKLKKRVFFFKEIDQYLLKRKILTCDDRSQRTALCDQKTWRYKISSKKYINSEKTQWNLLVTDKARTKSYLFVLIQWKQSFQLCVLIQWTDRRELLLLLLLFFFLA